MNLGSRSVIPLTLAASLLSTSVLDAASPTVVLAPVPLVGVEGKSTSDAAVAEITAKLRATIPSSALRPAVWGVGDESTGSFLAKPLPPVIADLLTRAKEARRNMDYPAATRSLNLAIEQMEQRLVELGDTERLHAAYVELAVVYLAMEEPALATPVLAKVVRLNPGSDLDPRRFPPSVVTAFNTAKGTTLVEPKTRLVVETTPKGAQIAIDGLLVGETPATIQLYKGRHLLQITAAGHEPLLRALRVVGGGLMKITDTLTPRATFVLAEKLRREAELKGRRAEGLALAKDFSEQQGAEAVLLTGIAPIDGGYALFMTLTTDPPYAIIGVVSSELNGIDTVLRSMVNRLAVLRKRPPPKTPDLIAPAGSALGLGALNVDFETRLFGAIPGIPTMAKKPKHEQGPAIGDPVGPVAKKSVLSSPWFWGGVGTAVVGAVVVGVLLGTPDDKTVRDPDQLTILVKRAP